MLDMLDPVDLSNIQDENARQLIDRLLNLIEAVSADLRNAQAEIQQLRDEINRLKGEQGKPNIKANKPKPPWSNYSRWNRSVANPSRTGSAPRKQRSGSIANRSWKWTRPACQRMLNSRAMKMW
jgi:hypothetical protein